MKARLKDWRRRWRVWVRGECEEEGCTRPCERWYRKCWPHLLAQHRRIHEGAERAKFEREVRVAEEALRRMAARAARD